MVLFVPIPIDPHAVSLSLWPSAHRLTPENFRNKKVIQNSSVEKKNPWKNSRNGYIQFHSRAYTATIVTDAHSCVIETFLRLFVFSVHVFHLHFSFWLCVSYECRINSLNESGYRTVRHFYRNRHHLRWMADKAARAQPDIDVCCFFFFNRFFLYIGRELWNFCTRLLRKKDGKINNRSV